MIDRKVAPGMMLLPARHGILAGLWCLMILAGAAPAASGGSADDAGAAKRLPDELAALSEELACLRPGSDVESGGSGRKAVFKYGILPGEDKARSAIFHCRRWNAEGTRVEGEVILAYIDESGSASVLDRLRAELHGFEIKSHSVDDTDWARQLGFASRRMPISGALQELLSDDRVVAFEVADFHLYFANGDGEWIVATLDW